MSVENPNLERLVASQESDKNQVAEGEKNKENDWIQSEGTDNMFEAVAYQARFNDIISRLDGSDLTPEKKMEVRQGLIESMEDYSYALDTIQGERNQMAFYDNMNMSADSASAARVKVRERVAEAKKMLPDALSKFERTLRYAEGIFRDREEDKAWEALDQAYEKKGEENRPELS